MARTRTATRSKLVFVAISVVATVCLSACSSTTPASKNTPVSTTTVPKGGGVAY